MNRSPFHLMLIIRNATINGRTSVVFSRLQVFRFFKLLRVGTVVREL